MEELSLPAVPADLDEAIAGLAAAAGVGVDVVWLAARLKVAMVVTGAPVLSDPEATWRDLIARVAEPAGREEAETAWRAAAEQEHVSPERTGRYLLTAVRLLTGSPDAPHTRDGLLTPAELDAVVKICSGPDRELPGRRFHELFEERVRRHPQAVAAMVGDRSWTYEELNRHANKIAWWLCRAGLQSEDVVAVACERGLEWLAAVLAVFKAGGAYLPLEPHFPAARMARVLARSECRWALADPGVTHLHEAIAGLEQQVGLAELPEVLSQDLPDTDPLIPVAEDQLAYIYFTSGSTGEPKGAMCEHGGFLNHLYAKIEDLGIDEGSVVAQTAPQCFDISLWQLVAGLLVGGTTVIVEQDVILDVRRFLDTLAENGVQIAQLVPTYLDVVLSTLAEEPRRLPALRCLAATGEALKKELVNRWFAQFRTVSLVNCYGTTEVSDDTNHEVMRQVPWHRSVPLGKPVRNTRVYVMDEHLTVLPVGAPGEIVFSGICVGRGYVNDPERTAAVFGRDPLRPHTRLYRTGDFGRWLPSGDLEYLGRRDSQVKVSGFRIEIGEIENRLLQVPGVRDGAVVIAGSAGDPQLVGYYSGPAVPDPELVAKALGESLPDYMVPRRLYHLDALPLSANGKIDKLALTARAAAEAGQAPADDDFELPVGAAEQRVAGLWAELLKVPLGRIGRGSRFAELGGTSLAAIRLSIALDRKVTVADLRDTPTVADVAALLERSAA